MPSSSSPTLPGLTSGSSSTSISSVETRSDGGSGGWFGPALVQGLGPGLEPGFAGRAEQGQVLEENEMAPVVTDMIGDGTRARSQASSSSWSTATPSVSSAGLSLADLSMNPNAESGIYVCLFHMLDCHDAFDDAAQWRTHVLSHFRTHPPPRTARCPLCPDTEFIDKQEDAGAASPTPIETGLNSAPHAPCTSQDQDQDPDPDQPSAWDRLLNHVAGEHYQHGQTLAGSRPDFELMRYLYGLRLISDAQFKAMQLAPAPSSPAYHRSQDGVRASIGSADEPYCAPYSRRREERMRGQQRGVSVV
ncbi:uncharacterized protein N7482_001791 [Penicillium canariense]|uniref:Uncharacterized protein n=1 Tax=Penicillium canariense TaxID=189055 RepID=A0A9W9IE34_9EURO|nr:uncharacterized protein N7482_001791 [Penicillium canariense]KAJ5175914.1 hypothetical protein N7482_001791 [Penicillium canariense]